ncbi:ebp domain-containing protein [Diplodia corticola]|uniref:Ebp domain-containing protein n=1 Tax=Diplodia corticola TaxID=236234 RepID=A0A1J9S6P8_9PEZI|nr:ebp domain-containing protein [Diplodia corticola]OJD35285.1 ebp domain-containing protein [Diplodia corticola]
MAKHPYYPLDLELRGYTENAAGLTSLFAAFSTGVSVILGTALLLSRRYRPSISPLDGSLVLWFVLSGSLHCFFEGYFILNHSRMPAAQDFFGQLWKEYAKSDSRYLAADPLVLTLETITVLIWGPLSFLTSWCIVSESPYRLPLQALVSTGHLYSDTLYYVTSFLDMRRGVLHSRPEALYFWVYFVVMNALWIIVPAYILYQSITGCAQAVATAKKSTKNGSAAGYRRENPRITAMKKIKALARSQSQ